MQKFLNEESVKKQETKLIWKQNCISGEKQYNSKNVSISEMSSFKWSESKQNHLHKAKCDSHVSYKTTR